MLNFHFMPLTLEIWIRNFITESNSIEGIQREATEAEINEAARFIELEVITLDEIKKFMDSEDRYKCPPPQH